MKIVFYLSLFCVFAFSSCKKNENMSAIDSDILIELRENIDGETELVASTERIYGTLNNPIIFSLRKMGTEITIKFKKVNEIGMLMALSPAMAKIDLSGFSKEEYKIKFKLNGRTTIGYLKTNPFSIEIDNGGNVRKK